MKRFLQNYPALFSLWAPALFTILGFILYSFQLWIYAHSLLSNLDEGAYLYKGYLFVTGQYRIYQDYGPWSNHMPFSFLIPGVIQLIFGPGLESPRYFMIILAIFTLFGIWILSRRMGGLWWATVATWVYAINPTVIKMYSTAVSQGLTAFMLTWSLVLVLGAKRPIWQLMLGSCLASLMVMTRETMLPVLPILALYIFWEHGLKTGALSILVIGTTLIAIHGMFWPGILQVWGRVIPSKILPILKQWNLPKNAVAFLHPTTPLDTQMLSLFRTLRFHFPSLAGGLASWLLWPKKKSWDHPSNYRTFVFLSCLFVVLLGIHSWAVFTKNYCDYCLEGYLAFFSMLGFLIVVTSFSFWRRQLAVWHQTVIGLTIILLSAGIGFGTFEDNRWGILDIGILRIILDPAHPSPGIVKVSDILINKFGLSLGDIRRLDPLLTGAAIGIVLLLIGFSISQLVARRSKNRFQPLRNSPSIGYCALTISLLCGTLFSPSPYLGGGKYVYDCGGDVLRSYRATGEYLRKLIPPGSLVYWRGGESVASLLYLPGVRVYPPQLNSKYSYYISGESDELLKLGFWNEELDRRWLREADFILIGSQNYVAWIKDYIDQPNEEQLPHSPPQVSCQPNSRIDIYKRLP